jgi:hypothetical protein
MSLRLAGVAAPRDPSGHSSSSQPPEAKSYEMACRSMMKTSVELAGIFDWAVAP